jgi:electron transport complex protein RnfB
MDSKTKPMTRREILGKALNAIFFFAIGGAALAVFGKTRSKGSVWQIDPAKCMQCGRCATQCVVSPSAVKCFHAFNVCGYCDLCFAYFKPGTLEFDTSAEKELCPTDALIRKYVEHPYYEYTIDKEKCIGCAKCVKGCQTFGNGSLYLQVDQTFCVNCNQCAIAMACPANAFVRLPSDRPYLLKGLQPKKDSKGS